MVPSFIDNVSDYVYVHLMRDLSLTKTLIAKSAMEKVITQAGQTVKHYHANNGRFADNGFIDAVNGKDQKITFCGIGMHHQNRIIENKNKKLTTGGHTLLLHGRRMWPVDQIVSAQPGLIPQMYGIITNQRLWGATTFVDHVSDYVYVHLMRDLSLTETLLAKKAMEKFMAQTGQTVKH